MSENLILNDSSGKLARYFETVRMRLLKYRPSSRNVAFTRKAWEAVGGSRWLTLTAEDALLTCNLRAAFNSGFFMSPPPSSIGKAGADLKAYLKMM